MYQEIIFFFNFTYPVMYFRIPQYVFAYPRLKSKSTAILGSLERPIVRNVVLSSYLDSGRWTKYRNPATLSVTPSSEPFRFYL
jgi:hypothetical protein